MTTITFKRTGGVSGRPIQRSLELDGIPGAEAQNLLQLLENANFFNLPERLDSGARPDEFRYTVTVEAGRSRHTVRTSDTAAPEPLRPLLYELSMLSRVGSRSMAR